MNSVIALMIGKIVVMIILLMSMVLLLFGIGYLFRSEDLNTKEDDFNLKKQLQNDEKVIGEKSIFSNFLVKNYGTERIDGNPRK